MADSPPNPTILVSLLHTQSSLIYTISSFLTVVIHQVLSLRRIYPPISFVSTRAYNYPVRQSRHPAVCAWITDAVVLIRDQLEKNALSNVAVCIFECNQNRVLERWVVDLRSLPRVDNREKDTQFAADSDSEGLVEVPLPRNVNLTDLEANFRGILSRLPVAAAKLQPLPSGPEAPELSFTVTMELGEDADRPVGRLTATERGWVAAEPDAFVSDADGVDEGRPGGKTVPIRRLEAGDLRMEVWIEESRAKFELAGSHPGERVIVHQGAERIDPDRGYEPESPNLNPGHSQPRPDYRT